MYTLRWAWAWLIRAEMIWDDGDVEPVGRRVWWRVRPGWMGNR